MVDVEYQPVKKIIVHEAIKYTFDDFVKMKAHTISPNQPVLPVRWCDGVIFTYAGVQQTPELINERVQNGVIHWDFIEFAEMPNYQKVVTHPDTQVQLRVIDASNNSAIADVIRHFKNDPKFFPLEGT